MTGKRVSEAFTEVRMGISAGSGDMRFAPLDGVGIILKGHHTLQALAARLVKQLWARAGADFGEEVGEESGKRQQQAVSS